MAISSNLFIAFISLIAIVITFSNILKSHRALRDDQLLMLAIKYDSVMNHEFDRLNIYYVKKDGKPQHIISSDLQPTFFVPIDRTIQSTRIKYVLAENVFPYTQYAFLGDTAIFSETGLMFSPDVDLFPTEYKLRLLYKLVGSPTEVSEDRYFSIIYEDNFINDIFTNPLWFIDTLGVYSLRGGVLLSPQKGQLLTQMIFKRKFHNTLVFDITILPRSPIISLQIFIGEAFSVMIGDGDNRTITLKKAVKNFAGKIEKCKARKMLAEPMLSNNEYSFRVERYDSIFMIQFTRGTLDNLSHGEIILRYVDSSVEPIIKERFKTVGLAVWRGSAGVEVKRVRLYQPSLINKP